MPRPAPYGFARDITTHTIPFPAGTGQVTSLLSLPFGYIGAVEKVSLYASVVAAGGGASRTFNVRKNSITGPVVATATVVLADLNAVGAAVKDIPVTAALADFIDTDTLVIEWATAGAVAFTAGVFHVAIRTRMLAQRAR